MKHLLSIILASGISVAHAEVDYSGIWRDGQGTHYSIHQSANSMVIGELSSTRRALSPAEQGSIYTTNNDLDLAISGYGFFVLVTEDGTYTYTREGGFQLSSANEIVNERGDRLLTESQLDAPVTTGRPESASTLDAGSASGCGSIFGESIHAK